MLNFLQSLSKSRIIFLWLLFFEVIFLSSSHVSAIEFGLSPSEINFQGKEGEKICKDIKIFSTLDQMNIFVDDKWNIEADQIKNLDAYSTDSEELNIIISYEDEFLLNFDKEIKICLKSEEEGKYYGVLLFNAIGSSLSIGVWLNADISKNIQSSKITGLSIKDLSNLNPINVFLPITLFNLIALLMLFFVYYKRKKIN